MGFIDFFDGACFKNPQVVYDNNIANFEEIQALRVGSAITVKLYRPRNGLKEIPGILRGYQEGRVTVEAGKETITFEKSEVALVRLRVAF